MDDRPPRQVLLPSGLQHAAVITAVGMVMPVLIADRIGADAATREAILGISLVAMAIGTLLQCRRWGPVGSGFLLPANTTAAYMAASLKAAEVGGMPLVCGMTIFAGVCVVLLSRTVRHLRPYLPPEIAGLAVTIIGITLGCLGFRLVFGADSTLRLAEPEVPREMAGIAVFAVTVGITVWYTGHLRLFAVLIGFLVGCAVAGTMGMLTLPAWFFDVRGWVRPPTPFAYMPTFEPALIPEFLAAAFACSLRAMGDITTCQRINDPGWKRPDMRTIQGGLLADGLSTMLAGLLGTVGLNTSSNSIGISAATGVTSRRVGYAVAGILLVLALAPRPRSFMAAVPLEVAGGVLMFSACFIIVSGVRIIMSRLLDPRKSLVVGLSLVLGLSHDLYPELYDSLPPALSGMPGSSLVVAMVTAILLNLLFRIGVTRRASLQLSAGADPDLPYAFMEAHGGEWGARRDVVAKVTAVLVEFREHADELLAPAEEARVEVRYDEFAVDVEFRYRGTAPRLPGADEPGAEWADLERDEAMARLRVTLLARLADRARAEQQGGEAVLRLHFEH